LCRPGSYGSMALLRLQNRRAKAMLTSLKNWPMWLCIATLAFVAIASAISYNYRHSAAELSAQREVFNQSKAAYDKRIASLDGATTILHTAGGNAETIRLPHLEMTCTTPLSCAPRPKFEELTLARLKQGPSEAVKRELDEHRQQVAAQSTRVEATGERVKSLGQIDDVIRSIMTPLISVLVTIASLYVILSGSYKDAGEKWAFGSIGTILGFWFKG
jgi:HPt (histidine-containing phosphotransfer) domain-containing protein